MRNRYLYITLLAVLGFNHEALFAQMLPSGPKLVVNIAIDQLRTDYMETFASLYGNDGFKKLLNNGIVYSNASYNFTPVDRASAIASISTGTTPYYNGIVGSEWLNTSTLRPQNCVLDKNFMRSPDNMETSTIGDEIKVSTKGLGKVFSFAVDADAAILSAGHAADGVAWIENGNWKEGNYYQPLSGWISGYCRLNKPGIDANKNITDIALSCMESSGIGLDDKADLINITYSSQQQKDGDKSSLMDAYMNLDKNLARLISGIESKLGHDHVLFVLTSTGYTIEEEDDNDKYRIPTGKLNITRTANLLNMYLGALYGSDQYIDICYKNQIFLNHKLLESKNINFGEALKRAQEFLLQLSGVRNVYNSTQLLTSESSQLEKTRNGFRIDKCGDLIISAAPGWKIINENFNHTYLSRASFIPFPIIFYGANLHGEKVTQPVFTDRIASTIGKAIRIRGPNACTSEPLF